MKVQSFANVTVTLQEITCGRQTLRKRKEKSSKFGERYFNAGRKQMLPEKIKITFAKSAPVHGMLP